VRELDLIDLEYQHVDVFSRRALRGDGLVVVLGAADLPAAVMQDVTREVRQFETAFLTEVDLPGRSARLRIFTEDEELDFAGVRPRGESLLIHQGRFTGRPSTIEVRPEPDGRLWVGGPVAPVASGRFHARLT